MPYTTTTETNHGIIDYFAVTSTGWWDGLPKDIKGQLGTTLKEVTAKRNGEAFQVNEANKIKAELFRIG
ncbi:MAG: hypothetical protein V7740_11190 [Pseudomonas marincola]